jgi:hypothetical protein
MKTYLIPAVAAILVATAHAQTPAPPTSTCRAQAAEKKLAGAAMTSFMKKCENDAKKSCEAVSNAKKLSGAAKNSHMRKCLADTVGT